MTNRRGASIERLMEHSTGQEMKLMPMTNNGECGLGPARPQPRWDGKEREVSTPEMTRVFDLEREIDHLRSQLAQAQASLAAARAQLLEESDRTEWQKKEINSWLWWYHQVIELFNNGEPKDFDALLQEGPQSKNLSLAKLLAEERPPKDSPITLLVNALHDPRWQEESSQIARAIADKARAEVDRYLQIPQTPVARVAELKGEQP